MRKFLKTLLKVTLVSFFIITFFVMAIFIKGYTVYRNITIITPISNKVSEIKFKKSYTKLENISSNFTDAIIAVEDSKFYSHNGYDLFAIARSTYVNIKSRSYAQGGSTITQQLAKNMYFTSEKTIIRKVAELFIANNLEHQYSKDEILELYLNSIYYGNSYYSIKDASLGYFNVLPCNLSLDQATMLAGIPNAPSLYSPTVNLNLSLQRQKHVINRMVIEGYLSYDTAQELLTNVTKRIK